MKILCSLVFSVMLSISDASMSPESNAVDIQGVKLFLDGLVADLNENYQVGMKFYHPVEICPKVCMEDENCTSVFWTNSSNSECRIISNNEIDVEFVPGELYYCKDCKSTKELIDEGFNKGVIDIQNVALNKATNASSYNNATAPSNAVDDDEDTYFASNDGNINQWLMVDLAERHFITDIQITVHNDPESMKKGGNLIVCLVDEFDFNDTCPSYSQIMIISNNLRENVITENALKSTMGRFLVLQKINKGQVLEISDLEVRAVVPKISYQCAQCNLYPNTVCDDSKPNPMCQCMENYFPVNGNGIRQCQDPCETFKERNNICTSQDDGTQNCQCNKDFYPVYKDESCHGCEDPCKNFKDRNNICIPEENGTCECKDNFYPVYKEDPCGGCRVIPSNYKNFGSFGWLKVHDEDLVEWETARTFCLGEGGDLFVPGPNLPILPVELGLPSDDEFFWYWIGARRGRDPNSPFKGVTAREQSVIPDDSLLWSPILNQPSRLDMNKCLIYSTESDRIGSIKCNSKLQFICQIIES